MSANPTLRVLAIDPGLAHCGLVVAEVVGLHQLTPVELRTVATDVGDPLVVRLEELSQAVGDVITKAQRGNAWLHGVVLEDPTESVQTSIAGRRKDPRAMYKLCAAYGAIAAAVTHWVGQDRLTTVGVSRWYPRDGRATMRHEVLLERIRARHQVLIGKSEHVAFATGLADWWSRNVAPVLWQKQRQAAGVSR